MRTTGLCLILCGCCVASGCAVGLAGSAALSKSMRESGRVGGAASAFPVANDLSELTNEDAAEPSIEGPADGGSESAGDAAAEVQAAEPERAAPKALEPQTLVPQAIEPKAIGAGPQANDAGPQANDAEPQANDAEPQANDAEPQANDAEPKARTTEATDAEPGVIAVSAADGPSRRRPKVYTGPRLTAAAPDIQEVVVAGPEVIPGLEAGDSDFKAGAGETELDRFARSVADVPLDIRPTEGVMPDNQAGVDFVNRPGPGDLRESEDRPLVVCSYTPWTICYRPLYFEEIQLERYGRNFGIFQPAVSGAHFFATVPILPYKMTVRPPRSCECSNGFSRIGDLPPPGYGQWHWRWDAAVVETIAITGVVFILP